MAKRDLFVHLAPPLVDPKSLEGCTAVAIDVLRATTTIVHALAAGCASVRPCAEVDDAKSLAASLPKGTTLLAGERDGKPIAGFDLGNSPREFTAKNCQGKTLDFTTTNGTRAIHRALSAELIVIASFVNFSAICEHLHLDARPIHVICAGRSGEPCVEDTLLAGALVECFSDEHDVRLNDGARLAWDCFENHGRILLGALQVCEAGEFLIENGYSDDVRAAAEVDKFALAPEVRRDPLRIELAGAGIVKKRWVK